MKVRLITNEPKPIPVDTLEAGQLAAIVECQCNPACIGSVVVGVDGLGGQEIGRSWLFKHPTTLVRPLQPGEKLVIE